MSVGAIAAAPTRSASAKNIGIAGLILGVLAWVIMLPLFLLQQPGAVGDPRAGGDAVRSDRRRQRRVSQRRRRLPTGAVLPVPPRIPEQMSRRRAPEARVHVVDPGRGDAPLRHPAAVRRAGRDHLRAQRRDEHRARGHDADGRLLRHLGADVLHSWVLGCLVAMLAGGADGADPRDLLYRSSSQRVARCTGINFLALHQPVSSSRTTATTGRLLHRQVPNVKLPLIQDVGFFGGAILEHKAADVDRAAARPPSHRVPVQDQMGASPACCRREAKGGGDLSGFLR